MENRSLNERQAQIVRALSNSHPERLQKLEQENIFQAQTLDELDKLEEDLTLQLKKITDMFYDMPPEHTMGLYGSIDSWDTSENIEGSSSVMVVNDDRSIEFLTEDGKSLQYLKAAYVSLELLRKIIPALLQNISERKIEFRYGPSAPTPYREIGLLKDKISIEQMHTLGTVLEKLTGTIDLHQFQMNHAAYILNTLRLRCGFIVNKSTNIRYIHTNGESDWYGTGKGRAKRPRDLVKHLADSLMLKNNDYLTTWVQAIEETR